MQRPDYFKGDLVQTFEFCYAINNLFYTERKFAFSHGSHICGPESRQFPLNNLINKCFMSLSFSKVAISPTSRFPKDDTSMKFKNCNVHWTEYIDTQCK